VIGLGDLVISNAQLKSGRTVYKLTIEIINSAITAKGIAFHSKKSTTKNSQKHVSAQIRANLEAILEVLNLKKHSKKVVTRVSQLFEADS
jgi:hypothetical protein